MTADMATITSTTTYTAKPDVSFKGYYLNADGGLTSTICQNDLPTFIARGNVVDCCASAPGCVFPEPCTACAYPTACSNNAEVYDFSVSGTAHTWPCRGLTCKTLMIYESYPHSTKGWSKTAHWCVGDSDPTVLFRNYESTLDMTITGITKPTSSPTSVPASTTASMPQDTGSSDSSSGGKSDNKAGPIAGGVVGGVAAVAIVIAALFFIMKRQKKKNLELQAVNEIGTEYVAAGK
ncbi:hypothetical protein N8T08_001831 [Aspergillus melleus]|uniref:Uncharacterized protein n=1 Tax=Aspergillus melleus TaxID=138277 RepID=A0ACC3B9M5_9EURO|nr:hypothetical protein N8T08_001831 [Aspergillus melleus]